MQRKGSITGNLFFRFKIEFFLFNIDIERCRACGAVKMVACIKDWVVIERILTHLKKPWLQPKRACCQKAWHCRKRACSTAPQRN
jgi:hypothetical protein